MKVTNKYVKELLSKDLDYLKENAQKTLIRYVGDKVYYRGLLEFSNICDLDCRYCGIRRSNKKQKRYMLDIDEMVKIARWCGENGYGSLVLQSGERRSKTFTDFVEDAVRRIKRDTVSEKMPDGLGITLSLGEQDEDTYKRWFDAGAHRYLLRIETSERELFEKIHPKDQSFDDRVRCIDSLKRLGYQTGTGVMIGLPGQTIKSLAKDIMFMKEHDIDMVGMGPYIIHDNTPMRLHAKEMDARKEEVFELSLKMIAAVRIVLRDVNIAAASALQAMYPLGREEGLKFGANVIMPLVTPNRVRKSYQLYDNKPCIDEHASQCKECLKKRITGIDRPIGLWEWGDPVHYTKKAENV